MAHLLRRTFASWWKTNPSLLAAGLSFFTLFSVIPLMLIVVTVASRLFGIMNAQDEIVRQAGFVLGPQAAGSLSEIFNGAARAKAGKITLFNGLIFYFAGSQVFNYLQQALNAIWKITPKHRHIVKRVLRPRVYSLFMVLGFGVLMVVFFVFDTALKAFGHSMLGLLPWLGGTVFVSIIGRLIPFALLSLLLASTFKFVPEANVDWKDVWIGAFVTAAIFFLGRNLLVQFLKPGMFESFYGVAGSAIVILFWLYFSAQVLLFGAQFTWVYANTFGSRRDVMEGL